MSARKGIRSDFLSYNQESWEEEELHIKGKGPIALELKRKEKYSPCYGRIFPYSIFWIPLGRAGEKVAGQILLVHNTFTNERKKFG